GQAGHRAGPEVGLGGYGCDLNRGHLRLLPWAPCHSGPFDGAMPQRSTGDGARGRTGAPDRTVFRQDGIDIPFAWRWGVTTCEFRDLSLGALPRSVRAGRLSGRLDGPPPPFAVSYPRPGQGVVDCYSTGIG